MGSQTAYQCDGPECTELTTKERGKQYPDVWPRVVLKVGGKDHVGCFHRKICAVRWLDDMYDNHELGPTTNAGGDLNDPPGGEG